MARICVPELRFVCDVTSLTSLRPTCGGLPAIGQWMDRRLTITRKAPARMRKATCLASLEGCNQAPQQPELVHHSTTDLQMLFLIWIYKTSLALSTSLLLTRSDSLLQLYCAVHVCTIHSGSPCFLPAANPISFLSRKTKQKKNMIEVEMTSPSCDDILSFPTQVFIMPVKLNFIYYCILSTIRFSIHHCPFLVHYPHHLSPIISSPHT